MQSARNNFQLLKQICIMILVGILCFTILIFPFNLL